MTKINAAALRSEFAEYDDGEHIDLTIETARALLDAYEELREFKAQLHAAEERAIRQLPPLIEAKFRIDELERELVEMKARHAS